MVRVTFSMRSWARAESCISSATNPALFGFHCQPIRDCSPDRVERLLPGRALGMASGKVQTRNRPTFVGFNKTNPILHVPKFMPSGRQVNPALTPVSVEGSEPFQGFALQTQPCT